MLGEFESFYYNRNVRNVSRYEKPNFLLAPHLIWYIDSYIPGKKFSTVFFKKQRTKEEIPVSLTLLWENLGTYAQEKWCYEVFAIHHVLIYEPFES